MDAGRWRGDGRCGLLLLLAGCVGPVPVEGVWVVPEPEVVEDACGLYRDASPTRGGAVVSEVRPGGFVLDLEPRGPTDCALDGRAFACAPWLDVMDLAVVELQVALTLEGTFRDPWHAAGTLTATVDCEGVACTLLPAIGLDPSCRTSLDWAAVYAGR